MCIDYIQIHGVAILIVHIIQKHFQKVVLIGFAIEISKSTHTSMLIAQDTSGVISSL